MTLYWEYELKTMSPQICDELPEELMEDLNLAVREKRLQAFQPTSSKYVGFGELAKQKPKIKGGSQPMFKNRAEAEATRQHMRLIFSYKKRQNKSSFKKKRSHARPKFCWIIVDDALTPLSECPRECLFHKCRRKFVEFQIKFNTKYSTLKKNYKKKRSTLQTHTVPPPNPVNDLERMFAHSHIDQRRDAFSGFSELLEKMETFSMQDIEIE